MSTPRPLATNLVIEPQAGQPTNFRRGGCPSAAMDKATAALVHGGRICVLGRLEGGNQPSHAKAFVYRAPGDAPVNPDSNAVHGICGDFQQPVSHQYRFIENDPVDGADHLVPCAQDDHSGNDGKNFLVVWTSEDGTNWERWEPVQFIGRGEANETECDSLEFNTKGARSVT